jgi:hypothetical protein
MKRAATLFKSWLIGMGVLVVVWLVVAEITFTFRHPWATSTERLIYTPQGLMFKRVSYSEMRLREGGR